MHTLPVHEAIEKNGVVTTKDEHEVKPALREEIDGVMLQNDSSLAHDRLQVIEQLRLTNTQKNDSFFRVFIHNQALELLIPSRAELLSFHLHDERHHHATIQCRRP